MQVTRTDIDFVRDVIDRRSRYPVFVEQEETRDEDPVPGIACHRQLMVPDTLSDTQSA